MTGFELSCMVVSLLIPLAFIVLHVIKSHHGEIQPVDPLYLRVILANWTLMPIAFSFTFFLVPYTLFADTPLSFYRLLPTDAFPKEWHGFTILLLAFIFGLFGFLLCFFVIEKLYLRCFITKSGPDTPFYIKSLYWFSSWGCLVILWAIIGMDLYAAFAAQNTAIAAALLPVTLIILALPLYFVE